MPMAATIMTQRTDGTS